FDGSVVLFDDVVQIFDPTDFDVRLMFCAVAFDRRRVGAALVDRDLLGNAMMAYRLAQEPQCGTTIPLGGQQEVYGGASSINRPIQIFPGTFDIHIGLIKSPAGANRALAGAKLLIQ